MWPLDGAVFKVVAISHEIAAVRGKWRSPIQYGCNIQRFPIWLLRYPSRFATVSSMDPRIFDSLGFQNYFSGLWNGVDTLSQNQMLQYVFRRFKMVSDGSVIIILTVVGGLDWPMVVDEILTAVLKHLEEQEGDACPASISLFGPSAHSKLSHAPIRTRPAGSLGIPAPDSAAGVIAVWAERRVTTSWRQASEIKLVLQNIRFN